MGGIVSFGLAAEAWPAETNLTPCNKSACLSIFAVSRFTNPTLFHPMQYSVIGQEDKIANECKTVSVNEGVLVTTGGRNVISNPCNLPTWTWLPDGHLSVLRNAGNDNKFAIYWSEWVICSIWEFFIVINRRSLTNLSMLDGKTTALSLTLLGPRTTRLPIPA